MSTAIRCYISATVKWVKKTDCWRDGGISFIMAKYYPVHIIFGDKNFHLIWYDNQEDGFMAESQKLITFDSIGETEAFCREHRILLESGTTRYDFTNVIAGADRIRDSEDCRTVLNAWNFFSDLAKTCGEGFLGDSDQGRILEIYHKLFHGCNLKAMNPGKEEYTPDFDEDERKELASVLRDGISILDKNM